MALCSTAAAASISAHSGDVSATFSYTIAKDGKDQGFRLQIERAGLTLYNKAVSSSNCSPYCGPAALGPHQPALRVVDLEADGEPDVVLGLFSGGAHCCFIDQVFSYDPGTATYTKTEHNFVNAGADLEILGGRFVFLSANNAFYYEFTDYADSGAPIQIFRFKHGFFLDDTRSYPALIRKDAAQWWTGFTHDYSNGEGLIAAWAADEYLLEKNQLVNSRLEAELRANHLHSTLPGNPTGKQFIAALKRFLIRQGYGD